MSGQLIIRTIGEIKMSAYADENKERDQSDIQGGKVGLGEISGDSRVNGAGQIGATQESCQGLLSTDSGRGEEATDIGKILERLDALEKRHLDYLRSHKSRLEARWQEDVNEEAAFLQESQQLREDIHQISLNK